jgi:5-carboxyvanillate decarboxylase
MKTRREFVKAVAAAGIAVATLQLPKIDFAADTETDPGNAGSQLAGGHAPAQTIDWHTHWLSPGSVAILSQRTSLPRIDKGDDGQLTFVGILPKPLKLALEFTDVDARLKHLEAVGVDRQIISWPTTLGADALLSAAEAKPLWTTYNNELADLVRKYPQRFSGLAALPTSDIPWAATELERAHRDLGLIGGVLPVGAFQTPAAAELFRPIFDVAQKYHSHVYLHTGPASPGIPGQIQPSFSSDDAPAIRTSFETASTFEEGARTLGQSDFLDSYPDVTVQIALLGGLSSFLAAQGRGGMPGGSQDSQQGFGRLYFDTGVYGRSKPIVDFAVARLGADRVLFGSDYPLATTDKTISVINASALSDADKSLIFAQNGQTLFASKANKQAG